MGKDLIGWRGCSLQRELGPNGFLDKLKLRAYRAAVEQQVSRELQATTEVTITITGQPSRVLLYPQLVAESERFGAGIPDCATCPIARDRPVGCYQYVGFPIDEAAERLIFEFFVQPTQLGTKDSICDQVYRDVISNIPGSGTGWHLNRGPRAALAAMSSPLKHRWGGLFSKKSVDSAQILGGLFIPLETPPALVAYARLWMELTAFAQTRGFGPQTQGTIGELFQVSRLVVATIAFMNEGGRVLVDPQIGRSTPAPASNPPPARPGQVAALSPQMAQMLASPPRLVTEAAKFPSPTIVIRRGVAVDPALQSSRFVEEAGCWRRGATVIEHTTDKHGLSLLTFRGEGVADAQREVLAVIPWIDPSSVYSQLSSGRIASVDLSYLLWAIRHYRCVGGVPAQLRAHADPAVQETIRLIDRDVMAEAARRKRSS